MNYTEYAERPVAANLSMQAANAKLPGAVEEISRRVAEIDKFLSEAECVLRDKLARIYGTGENPCVEPQPEGVISRLVTLDNRAREILSLAGKL